MRLILLGSLLHWQDQLPVGGVPVYSQMSRSKSQQFSQLSLVLGLQENGELLQEVETIMVSSSGIRRECVYRVVWMIPEMPHPKGKLRKLGYLFL